MCNLYSITTNQAAIIALFRVVNRYVGNLAPMPGVFPDYRAPIVRAGADGRELATARWGMPSSAHALMEATKKRAAKLEAKGKPVDFKELLRMEPDSGTTNIRNVKSKHWTRWLGPEHRCVVPFNSFSEFNKTEGGDIWFALDETRPLACFAGIWTNWTSVRKVKEGETTNDLYAFLTTEPNAEVGAIHPKAMPVILTTPDEVETWMAAPPDEALKLQRGRSSMSTWTPSTRRSSSGTIRIFAASRWPSAGPASAASSRPQATKRASSASAPPCRR
jgi:putative SOS response-associated peptidase YedK